MSPVPWLFKALLVAAKSKRGRELLFAGALGAYELARSKEARRAYAKVREVATDPALRDAVSGAVASVTARATRRR